MNTPLIDRSIFFDNPEISAGNLSPNGEKIAFLKAHNGIMNLYVKEFNEPFTAARLLTDSQSPIMGYFWSYDSRFILYVNDNNGDENYNIFKVNPSSEIFSDHTVPPSINLTPLEGVTAQIYLASKLDPNKMVIGLNDRDKAWHDLYHLDIDSGKLTLIYTNINRMSGWIFDWEENLRLAYRTAENGFQELLRVDGDQDFTKIYETNLQEQAYAAGWTADNNRFYLVSNKGDTDLTGLYLCNPQNGETELVEMDPEKKVDFGGIRMDKESRTIISTSYVDDKVRYYWKDATWQADFELIARRFPGREISFTSVTKDYSKCLVAVTGDQYAGDVLFYNRDTKELIHQYTPRPNLKKIEKQLCQMTPISYTSSDGLNIPAYLSLPHQENVEKLPLVLLVHGGPKGPRDHWGYNAYVQFFANRGYAVLQVNFRASGGYGKHFLNAGDKEWGRKMQDDLTWGVQYLIDSGKIDRQRVAIVGGSYGGYATLAGLAFTPDMYACGVDIVGPSNLFTLLESIPPYWEAGRKWLYEMVGDPDTEEGQALLRERSPLFSVDKINKPLLIIQGANDPRVKQQESDQIVAALREKGKDVVYLNALDEGHGYRKPMNRMAMFAEIEKFLAAHLDGRYQESMPSEVASTLEILRVDVETVEA